MEKKEIEQIIKDTVNREIDKALKTHRHNNSDSPQLNPLSLIGMVPLPGCSEGDGIMCLSTGQSVSGPPTNGDVLEPPQVVVFPIPVFYSGTGGASTFNLGDAPSGTVVMFDTGGPLTTGLYVKTLNGWYFFSRTSGPL